MDDVFSRPAEGERQAWRRLSITERRFLGAAQMIPDQSTEPRSAEALADESRPAAAGLIDAVKIYGDGPTAVHALDDVSVTFQKATFTAIMGPSGSGKSTLLHCAAGLEELTSGSATIAGQELSGLSDRALTRMRRDQMGFVFQSFNLVPTITAEENLTLPTRLAGRKPDPEWFDTVVDTLGLRDRLTHNPSELSGGQEQRVAVGRALMSRPEVIFADEPTGNLDSHSGQEVLGFLRSAVDDLDQTVVMVSHDALASARADRVLFLADGRLADEMKAPTTERILDRLKSLAGR